MTSSDVSRPDPDPDTHGSGPSAHSPSPPDPAEIPFDRLPDGFAERIETPGTPAVPRPAATVVLMRPAGGDRHRPEDRGLEILLLRRVRSAGFVPGAWVFPGGRVDRADGAPGLLRRLGEGDEDLDPARGRPGPAYVVAAIREAFEETGILLARNADGTRVPPAADDPRIAARRRDLLEGRTTFESVLESEHLRMDRAAVGYIAHWITPEAEPRRYDTRFFAAAVPAGTPARVHEAEATHAEWVAPADALDRHAKGELPMVFPTIRTLEALRSFTSPTEVLHHHREREIRAIMPRLVRTPTGVGIRMPDEDTP